MKTIRRSVYRARLEAQLFKYERRIQKMAENAYRIRQAIENMMREEAQDAIHQGSGQGSIGGESSDAGAGGSDISDPAIVEAVLDQQPAELSGNLRDPGINSGSAV